MKRIAFGDDATPASDVAWLWLNSQRWPSWMVGIVTADPHPGHAVSHEVARPHVWYPPNPRPRFSEPAFADVVDLVADQDPRLALSIDADLIVLGVHPTPFSRIGRLGGTAQWLSMRPPAPLVVARRGRRVRDVTAAFDGSPHATNALQAFLSYPWALDTHVQVLVVDDDHLDVQRVSEAASLEIEPLTTHYDVVVERGTPSTTIGRYVERGRPDLVVLGTRGSARGAVDRFGSTARHVVSQASCSVLLATACTRRDFRPGRSSDATH